MHPTTRPVCRPGSLPSWPPCLRSSLCQHFFCAVPRRYRRGTYRVISTSEPRGEPSKSGIIGLLCAALRRPRSEPVEDLAALRMGVRVDQEGRLLRDWHTAGIDGYLRASGDIERKTVITSTRYYLSDAAYLVGLEGSDHAFLHQLQDALNNPRWMLYLGRKSCPPSASPNLPDSLSDLNLETALATYPWISRNRRRYDELKAASPRGLRLVIEDPVSGSIVRNDHPLSFEKGKRQFSYRRTTINWVDWPAFSEEML
ncbi:MAG: type I-E CRISPR-associated protein Cas5/CasD [Caldilineaceae bacterium]